VPAGDASRRSTRLASAAAVARLAVLFLILAGAKRMASVQTLAAWASRPVRRQRRTPHALVVGRVLRAGTLVGSPDRDCLQRSLLLYRELRRAGAPATLVVGMRRGGGVLAGHAWVHVNGDVLVESAADVGGFEPVLTFPARDAAHAPARQHA
jgi:hypothetical protein